MLSHKSEKDLLTMVSQVFLIFVSGRVLHAARRHEPRERDICSILNSSDAVRHSPCKKLVISPEIYTVPHDRFAVCKSAAFDPCVKLTRIGILIETVGECGKVQFSLVFRFRDPHIKPLIRIIQHVPENRVSPAHDRQSDLRQFSAEVDRSGAPALSHVGEREHLQIRTAVKGKYTDRSHALR